MSKPMLRFEGFSGDWEKKKLGEIADVYQPLTLSKDEMMGGKYRVFGANGYVGQHDEYNHQFEQVGISCRGANSGTVNLISPKAWITGNTMVINVDSYDNIDKRFIYVQLSSQNLKYMVSGSAQPQIIKSDADLHKIKVPSLPEQELIGNFFKTIDDLILAQEQAVKTYGLYKEAMLQKMFPKKGQVNPDLRFEGFSDDWEEKKLGDISSIETGKLDANAMVDGGKYPYFTCAAQTYSINDYAFDGEALLIAGNGDIGVTKYYKGKFNAYQRTYVLMGYDNLIYLNYYLNLKLPERVHTMTYGSTMPYITMGVLGNMNILLPSPEEQTLIGDFFKSLDDVIGGHQSKLDQYKEMKESFLQKMFI